MPWKSKGSRAPKLELRKAPRWSSRSGARSLARVTLGYGALAGLSVALVVALRGGVPWQHPTPAWSLTPSLSAGASAVGGLAFALAAIVATRLIVPRFAWGRRLHDDLRPMAHDMSAARIVVVAGFSSVGEELLFRGLLTPAIGVGLSAALFGLAHQIGGPSRWVWVAWAGSMGVGLGLLFWMTGSLVGPLIAHATINAANLMYLRDQGANPLRAAAPQG